MKKAEIIVLDDDLIVRTLLTKELSRDFRVFDFSNGNDAISFLKRNPVDLVLLDIDLGPGMGGMETLGKLLEIDSGLSVIMVSSLTSVDTVVKSIRLGALDFIEKPIDIPTLRFRIKKTFAFKEMSIIKQRYFNQKAKDNTLNAIVGDSPEILKCREIVKNAGPMRLLLCGETGVGKTPFAKYSNLLLSRETGKDRPFEQINCACLKRERFVDELFGHVKGSYTGATSDKKGLVEMATGGDLFLDEIADLDLDCQAELLTFLDNYEYFRLGGTKKMKAKVRIISATNRDLKKMLEEGTFRKDLYSRVAQCTVRVPPLRERKSDIGNLIKHFIQIFSGFEKPVSEDVSTQLCRFDWEEGNVRDLKNVCEFMCITSRNSESIELCHLPEAYSRADARLSTIHVPGESNLRELFEIGYEKYLERIEYSLCCELLTREKRVKVLSDQIKMNRMTLSRKLTRLNLK